MCNGENTDVNHRSTKRGLDDTVAHANNEQKEEREGITSRIKDGDDDHKYFGTDIQAMSILEV